MPTQPGRPKRIPYAIVTLTTLTFVLGCVITARLIVQSTALAASITTISPTSSVAGGPDVTLTISASDFDTSTVQVLWNALPLADATVVDTSTLTASVPAHLTAVAGYATLVLTDAVNGLIATTPFTIVNPAPLIGTIDPPTAPAGAALTLTLAGTGYVNSSTVSLGFTALTVTAQTSTTLAAMAPAGTFTQSGVYTLTVANPPPGGGSSSVVFSVTNNALSVLTLSPNTASLAVSTTQVFMASGVDIFGNAVSPLTVTWELSPSSAGTILSYGPLTAALRAGTSPGTYADSLRASSGSISTTSDLTVTAGPLFRIAVTPPLIALPVNATQMFTAAGFDVYSNVVQFAATWFPPAGGTIQSTGALTMLFRAGTTAGYFSNAVQAAQGNVSGTASVTVTPGALAGIQLTPNAASLPVSATQVFTALGADAYGNAVTPLGITWGVTPSSAGSIQAGGGITGVFRAGTLAGSFTGAVRATSGTISAPANIMVTPGALARVVLTPTLAQLSVAATQVFTASGMDAFGNAISPLAVTWELSPSSAGTILSYGPLTAALRAGTSPGTYADALRASSGSISATSDITITAGPLFRIAITPRLIALSVSAWHTLTATGFDVYSNVVPGLVMAWNTLPGAGSIPSHGPLTATFVAGTTPGTYLNAIEASAAGVTGAADVVVLSGSVAQVIVSPGVVTLPVNATQLFTATVQDTAGNPLQVAVTWLQPAGGTIQSSGALTMLFKAGTTAGYFTNAIQAAQGNVSGAADVTVTPGPLAGIQVAPATASLPVSTTKVFTALGADAYGNAIPSFGVTWSVTPGSAGSIQQPSGGITGVLHAGTLAGSFTGAVRATSGGISGTAHITVTPGVLARIALTPTLARLSVAATQVFTASGYDAYDNAIPTLAVSWGVSPSLAGTIVPSGARTAMFQAGTRAGWYPNAVEAGNGGIKASASLTVTAGPVASITLIPGTAVLAISSTQIFSATGADMYGNGVSPLNLSWSVASGAGSLVAGTPATATFRAGTKAGLHPAAVRASQNGVTRNADITIMPGAPAALALRASPNLIRTDGISTSTITISVTDRFGNAVGAGTTVSVSALCPRGCTLTPPSGATGANGSFVTALTSTLREVTRTVTSTIHVTAIVSPAAASNGFITATAQVTGIFTPAHAYIPTLAYRYPLNNHTACSALATTPPSTVTQAADNTFNLYRFVATTTSYELVIRNYAATGDLLLYKIVADHCASSSTMNVQPITGTTIMAAQVGFTWRLTGAFAPGGSYLVAVYNKTLISQPSYIFAILPRPSLSAYKEAIPLSVDAQREFPMPP